MPESPLAIKSLLLFTTLQLLPLYKLPSRLWYIEILRVLLCKCDYFVQVDSVFTSAHLISKSASAACRLSHRHPSLSKIINEKSSDIPASYLHCKDYCKHAKGTQF
jgi:hypothetical protein